MASLTEARRPPSRTAGAVLGVLAAATALGVAELVAGLRADLRSPVYEVGDRVIDHVPVAVKTFAIDVFGTRDKPALVVGILSLIGVYAAVLGMVALRRNLVVALAGLGGFAAAGVAAASSDATDRLAAAAPTMVGALAAAAVLVAGHRGLVGWRGSPLEGATAAAVVAERAGGPVGGPGRPYESLPPAAVAVGVATTETASRVPVTMTRRTALLAGGAVAAFAGCSAAGGRWLAGRFSAAASRAAVRLPAPASPLAALPAGASAPAAGISPFVTPNRDFYRIDTALTVPQVQTQGYSLRVTGMVDRPLELSFDDLLRREVVEADITLTCVSNEVGGDLCGNARWSGVRLDGLLAEAGLQPGADQVVGRSVDGYTCGFPVAAATDGRPALVALAMNGEPLPLEHGFPARLIVPGIYGYASATKWLTEIELTRFADFDHYWARRGYAVLAPIKTQARIDTPRPLARIAAGAVAIGGVAWAQTRGIRRVEVRIDEGSWQDAVLADEVATTTWRQWHLPWDASPGRHTLTARATDGTGTVQPVQRAKPLPDGASGWHQTVVFVQDGPT